MKELNREQLFTLNYINETPIAYKPKIARALGSVTAGILLSQFIYWSKTKTVVERDGWFYKSEDEICKEMGMSIRQQQTARKILTKRGVLETEKRGLPAKNWYRIDIPKLIEIIQVFFLTESTSDAETGGLVMRKQDDILYTENTTENTFKLSQKSESNKDTIKVDPLIGFPLPEDWELIDYGYDSDDSHNFKVVDNWGDTVSRSKLKRMRENYLNESKPKVAPKRATQTNFEPYMAIWEQYPDLKSTGVKICANPTAKDELLPQVKRITPDLKAQINKMIKKYPEKELWEHAIKEYCKDIMNRPEDKSGYFQHRMSFFDFLNQKNGFTKFVNK